jgi:hypothetical protein
MQLGDRVEPWLECRVEQRPRVRAPLRAVGVDLEEQPGEGPHLRSGDASPQLSRERGYGHVRIVHQLGQELPVPALQLGDDGREETLL